MTNEAIALELLGLLERLVVAAEGINATLDDMNERGNRIYGQPEEK